MNIRSHILRSLLPSVMGAILFAGCTRTSESQTLSEVSLASTSVQDDSSVAAALQRADDSIQIIVDIPDDQRTFDNTIGAIDDMLANLGLAVEMPMFMAYVSTDAAEREAGQKAEEDVNNWYIDLGKRVDLYQAVKAYAATTPSLEGEQKRLLEHTLRDYRRAGMELSAEKREELTATEKEINRLSIEFEKNIREDATRIPLTRAELAGMDDAYLATLPQSGDLYLLGMSYPEFLPVMELCTDETTRKKAWLAYKRRSGQKNVEVLESIIKLRAEAANLLGYAHPADFETEIKMAKNAETVLNFYKELRPLVRKKALLDLEEFTAIKRSHTGDSNAKFYPWDFDFYKNRLLKEKYAVDSEKVREYFAVDHVIDGLFSITQSLYGLSYQEITEEATARDMPLWHEDVKLFEVTDTRRGEVLGQFYIDLHPRPNKYGHAAQWGLYDHKVWSDGHVTKPVAALVCNFTKPTKDKPALMSHDEVQTFFHEFGHCLHTLLSDATYDQLSGTAVERDFVEAPSQMFENWVWDADVLKTFARHYQTGEVFPDELLDGMLKARYLGSGMLAERQFFYGNFDMRCHLDPTGTTDTTQLAHDLWDPEKENVELYDPVPETFFQAAFGHMTGYQAGYYGYQWSLVYACDMFQRFKEMGMLNPEAGMYYRDKIISRGGTQDGLDLIKDYLGREPDMSAYLRNLGLEP